MIVEVNEFDIKNGSDNVYRAKRITTNVSDKIYTDCPIGLAIQRQGIGTARVGMNSLRFENKYIPLPINAEQFTHRLMLGGQLKPFYFELNYNEAW